MVEYKSGDVAYYHEDGASYQVQILENLSDEKDESYRVKVLSEVHISTVHGQSLPVGHEFKFFRSKTSSTFWCPRLEDSP